VAIAVPNFVRSRESAQSQLCIHNMSRIDVAKVNWAISAGVESDTVPVKEDLEPFFSHDQFPACPAGGEYDFGTASEPTLCSLVDLGHLSDAGEEEYEEDSSSTPSGGGSSGGSGPPGPKKPKPGRGKGKPPWL
jgi:hypothetical protein